MKNKKTTSKMKAYKNTKKMAVASIATAVIGGGVVQVEGQLLGLNAIEAHASVLSQHQGVNAQLSIGYMHSAFIRDGALYMAGDNSKGQTGEGLNSTLSRATKIPGLPMVKSVSLGGYSSMAIAENGDLYSWGSNDYGQLGFGDTVKRNTPTKVNGLSNVVAVSSGSSVAFAITEDGSLYASGYNGTGQLGLGDTTNRNSFTKVEGLSNVVAVSHQVNHTLALTADGSLYAWGYNYYGQLGLGDATQRNVPTKIQGLSNVVAISTGSDHSLALTADGSLYAWGYNYYGQLGLGDTTNRNVPTKVTGIANVKSIVSGDQHSVALTTDGSVYSWGYNTYGQLGLGNSGNNTNRLTPNKINGLSNIVTISADAYNSSAMTSNNEMYMWGINSYGQLGVGDNTDRNSPVLMKEPISLEKKSLQPEFVSELDSSSGQTSKLAKLKDGGIVGGGMKTGLSGSQDILLKKMDENGNEIWSKTLGSTAYDMIRSVEATDDGGFIISGYAGAFDGDFTGLTNPSSNTNFIAKYDSDGNRVWTKFVSLSSVEIYKIKQTSDGGYIGVGAYRYGSTYDAVTIKYDANGDVVWNQTYSTGRYYRTTVDIQEQLHNVTELPNGDFVVVGQIARNQTWQYFDHLFLGYDKNGNMKWANSFGGSNVDDSTNDVIATDDGGFIAVGQYNHGTAAIYKFNSLGTQQWSKYLAQVGGYDVINSIEKDTDGKFVISGYISPTTANALGLPYRSGGYQDAFIAKINESGIYEWMNLFGGNNSDDFSDVVTTSNNEYIMVGNFYSTDGDLIGQSTGSKIVKMGDGVMPLAKATFSPSNTSITKENISLTINYPKNAVTKEYKIGSTGTWTAYTSPVTVSANTTVYARSGNNSGFSEESSYEVTNIDNIGPEKATFVSSNTNATNQDVTVSVSFPDDAVLKQYKVGYAGTWTSYTSPVTLSANNTLYARSFDALGNQSEETSFEVNNIDKVAPTTPSLSADKGTPTNTDVKVSISYSNDSTIKEYRVNGGIWTSYNGVITMADNGKVEARAMDSAGNVSTVGSLTINNIDKTPPTAPTISADKTTPTNENVVLTVTFPADASAKEYRINDGNWTVYSGAVTITDNGKFEARAKDSAGNVSAVATYTVSNIDKIKPSEPVFTPSETAPTNKSVTVDINYPSDSNKKQYKIENGIWNTYTAPLTIDSNTTIYARSIDEAGNISFETSIVINNIDKIAPTEPVVQVDNVRATNEDVKLSITFSDDAVVKEYRLNGGAWQAYGSEIVLSENALVETRSKDQAGNYSTIKSYQVSNIDKTAPVKTKALLSKTEPTNTNVVVDLEFADDAVTKEYRILKAPTVMLKSFSSIRLLADSEPEVLWNSYTGAITMEENGMIETRSVDEAGNETVDTINITNIDKTAPNSPTMKEENNLLTIETTDADVKEIFYRLDGGEWVLYSDTLSLDEKYSLIELKAVDEAGNESEVANYLINSTGEMQTFALNWFEEEGAVAYKIMRNDVEIGQVEAPTTRFVDENVEVGVKYRYKVVPIFEDQTEGEGKEPQITPIDTTAPAEVTDLKTVDITSDSIDVSFTKPTNEDFSKTNFYLNGELVGETKESTFQFDNLNSETEYTIVAKTVDATGNESKGVSIKVTTLDSTAPGEATNLKATDISSESIDVSFTKPTDEDFAKTNFYLNGQLIGNTTENTFQFTNLTPETAYVIVAKTVDTTGNESEGVSITATTLKEVDTTAPAEVTNLKATDITENVIDVSFTKPTDEDFAKTNFYLNGQLIGNTTEDTFQFENLSPETVYTIVAKTVDTTGNESEGVSITATTLKEVDVTAPAEVTTLKATDITSKSIDVSFTKPTDEDFAKTNFYLNGELVGETTEDTFQFDNLTSETVYTIVVKTVDITGNESKGVSITATTLKEVDVTAPAEVTDLKTTDIASESIDISFTKPTVEDFAKTNFYLNGELVGETTENTFQFDNLSPETVYTIVAKTVDTTGNESEGVSITATTMKEIDEMTPAEVTDLKATKITSESIDVSFTKPTDEDFAKTNFYLNGQLIGETTENTFQFTNLTPETAYVIVAKTVDVIGNESEGVSITATTLKEVDVTAPAEITDLKTTNIDSESIDVSFVKPTDEDFVKTNFYLNDELIGNTTEDTFQLTNLTPETEYKIVAKTVDATGNESVGVSITATTIKNIDEIAPLEVTDLKATDITSESIDVSFVKPNDENFAKTNFYLNGELVGETTESTFQFENLTPETVYTIVAKTVDLTGKESTGVSITVSTVKAEELDETAPAEITDLKTTNIASESIDVSFTKPTDVDFAKTNFYLNGQLIGETTENTFQFTNLTANTEYTIVAKTVDATGNESEGVSITVTTSTGDEPSKPKMEIEIREGKIFVEWDAIFGADHYDVYRDGVKVAVILEDGSAFYRYEVVYDGKKGFFEVIPVRKGESSESEFNEDIGDAQEAVEKADETKTEEDIQKAKDEIDLLNDSPAKEILIDELADVKEDFADIMSLIAKERWDILFPKYGMSKVAYNSLVQTYYAIKYTGDNMYKMAKDKFALVLTDDKYYQLAKEQFEKLNIDYDQFVDDRIATDAEIKAESSVKAMESNYDPTYVSHTQELINAVEDVTIRASLQQRLDDAKAKYEASQLDKASADAIASVEKAESTKQTYYVDVAYSKVNALTNETLKSDLTKRLQALQAQMALDKKIADATRTVELAEQYKQQSYIDSAQTKINALPDGEAKTSLQQRLNVVKAGLPTSDQATIIKNATNYVSLAQSLKTQYYVDKAQGYINQIIDVEKKAELQSKLNAIVVK